MSDFYIYDADQISIVVAAIPIEAGFAEGEFMSIDVPAKFTMKRGAKGDVTRSKTYDGTAVAKLRLMQKSSSNAPLSALYALDCNTPNGAGVGPFLVKDRQGATVYAASKSWISKGPTGAFAAEDTVREWEISMSDLVAFEAA
jgi:hypothetical protein